MAGTLGGVCLLSYIPAPSICLAVSSWAAMASSMRQISSSYIIIHQINGLICYTSRIYRRHSPKLSWMSLCRSSLHRQKRRNT